MEADLERFGRSTVSPYLLGDGREPLALAAGGVTGVRRIGRYALMATEPATPPGTEDAALDEVLAHLRARRLLPVFAAVPEPDRFRSRGFYVHPIADEAVVDLAGFSLAGKRRANIRHSVTSAGRQGLRVVAFEDRLAEGVGEVSRQWLATKRGGEFGFTMGQLSAETKRRCLIRVAVDDDDVVVGFVTWFRCDDGRGYVLDLMRRAPSAPNPTIDLLVADGLRELAEQGAQWAGLGSVPRSPGPWADRFYSSDSLRFYKDKFAPRWRELHVVMPSGRHRLGGGWALFRASAPDRSVRSIVQELATSARDRARASANAAQT
jgi:lysylphosphatidylglycerol synthetase-like protein (DUF2156 family)